MVRSEQIRHMESVITTTTGSAPGPAAEDREDIIIQSWARCVRQYRLDPTHPQEARILPQDKLREHREMVEDFLCVARFGLEQLYQQIAGIGYVLLLTNKHGITVDYIGDTLRDNALRRAGLYLGADWNEGHAGTCAVGTCLATQQPLICHQTDHFDATHIDLTCSAAPIFDCFGDLLAVLDVSALHSPEPRSSQHMALQLVKNYARKIEAANFLSHFRHHWIVRFSPSPEFVEVDPEYLLAVDDTGAIIGFNRQTRELFEQENPGPQRTRLAGCSIEDLFHCRVDDLPRLMEGADNQGRMLFTRRTQQLFFAAVIAPRPHRRPSRVLEHHLDHPETAAKHLPRPLRGLSGGDSDLDRKIARAARMVDTSINILLLGETGTGKEYFAKALHEASLRAGKPFVAINCAALPESLIESELFGYQPGTFTGASGKGRRGLILEADGGTLFLDEIGDMPLSLQARLLRVLAQKEVMALGARHPTPVNLHVISATHRDLQEMVLAGEFREDLYYRLNGFTLELPPLRQRRDLAFIVERVLKEISGGEPPPRLAPEVMAALAGYHWPGNIRELHNVLQFAAAICEDGVIRLSDLPDSFLSLAHGGRSLEASGATAARESLPPEQAQLLDKLRQHKWNITAVARDLQVSRLTVYRRMDRWGIVPPHRL